MKTKTKRQRRKQDDREPWWWFPLEILIELWLLPFRLVGAVFRSLGKLFDGFDF